MKTVSNERKSFDADHSIDYFVQLYKQRITKELLGKEFNIKGNFVSFGPAVQYARTKLCHSELSANDAMRWFNAPDRSSSPPRFYLRHYNAFVTNFKAAEFRALYCVGLVI
ncbi:hypothetical protein EVAR_29886_1 [Eumeta japonica]|uniref:Uncharacterized protein n=1 Tax=Eumeta variegata TaxID=151549 RepID=A0A4C1V6P8_EUMVA|nr:hypothetical protein EVAR_29886_1 [Eumeta japonica]